MFGQCEFECEFEFEFEPELDCVVVDDPLEEPDDDVPLLAALAIAAPPTAIAPTTPTAASVFCMRVTMYHLLRSSVTLE
jgi:hypothetical protein